MRRSSSTNLRSPRLTALSLIAWVLTGALNVTLAQTVSSSMEAANYGTDFAYEHIGLEDGLSQGIVYSILQSRDGFMWFGTQSGLNRYDGREMKSFSINPFDSTAMPERALMSIQEDSKGDLWLMFVGSLAHYDRTMDRFTVFNENELDSTVFYMETGIGGGQRGVNEVFVDSRDRVWIISPRAGRGVQLVDGTTGNVTLYGTGDWNGGAIGEPRAMIQSPDGQLYVSTSSGVYAFDPEASSFDQLSSDAGGALAFNPRDASILWTLGTELQKINLLTGVRRSFSNTLSNSPAKALVFDPNFPDRLWLDINGRLETFNTESETVESLPGVSADRSEVSMESVFSIHADKTDILWVGKNDGMFHFDTSEQRFKSYVGGSKENAVLQGDEQAWFVFSENESTIWIGMDDGSINNAFLNRVEKNSGDIQAWGMNYGWPRGMAVDARDRVWVSAADDQRYSYEGLYLYDDRIGDLVKVLDTKTGLLPGGIRSIHPTDDGSIWLATSDGLVKYNHDTGHKQIWDDSHPAISDSSFVWIVEDTEGGIWAYGGSRSSNLIRVNPDTGEVVSIVEHAKGKNVLEADDVRSFQNLYADDYGRVWFRITTQVGTNSLVMYDLVTDDYTVFRHDPSDPTSWAGGIPTMSIRSHPTDLNIVYLTTMGFGVAELDVSTGSFRYYGKEDGLSNLYTYESVFDNSGKMWFGTNSGVHRFDPETGSFRRFDGKSGLPSLEQVNTVYEKSASGLIYFGTTGGLVEIDPLNARSNDTEPFVALTDFKLSNKSVEPGESSPLSTSITRAEEVTLSHDQNDISISFAAMHYKRPAENKLRYMLEPMQSEWIDPGDRREASYTNLSPGTYTFRVKGANSDGKWNEEGATLTIMVNGPWWFSYYAYFVYGLLFIGLVYAVDRNQRARIVRKEREAARERELEQAKEIESAYEQLKVSKEQLVQQEKLASLGSLTAGIAHEIKNPLNFVNNFAEVSVEMTQEVKDAIKSGDLEEATSILEEIEENSGQIAKHGKRADSIVRSMMQHARGGTSVHENVDVAAFLEENINLAWHGRRAKDQSFQADVARYFAEDLGEVRIQPMEMGRVILNLLNNAFDAVSEVTNGSVSVRTLRKKDSVIILVEDNGPGIPEDIREKIFEPFFTTKETGEGTGLGLSLSHDIVTKGHGGTLVVLSGDEGGAVFEITLPCEEA